MGGTGGGSRQLASTDDRVNVAALRDMTDDSGGRTEIVRHPADLDPATAGIADELSKQYDLGYTSPRKKDGQWHAIRVEVRNHAYRVRSRRGYVAN
jgi:VWFA-related protein